MPALNRNDRDPPRLLNAEEVAELLGCSARHVARLAKAGRLPGPIRLGSLVRWRRCDIDSWLIDQAAIIPSR